MPPITSSKIDGGDRYGFPFLGSIKEKLSENLDVSELDGTDFVDADGLLIPGTPLRLNNNKLVPVSGGGQTVRGIVLEQVKVAEGNTTTELDAADDLDVVIVVAGTIDRAILEFNIDRVLSANEVTAIDNASTLILSDPVS